MSKSDNFGQLVEIVRQIAKAPSLVVEKDTHLLDDKILDSLDLMDFIFQVQEQWDLTIPDEDLEKYRLGGLDNMAAYLERRSNSDST